MTNVIPPQHEGKQLDLKTEKVLENEEQSILFFKLVKDRLLKAYEWHHIAKVPAATFVLTDEAGSELVRKMKENDLIRIDIPGPGNTKGDGYDWVRVEKIIDEEGPKQLFSITLRPSSNPKNQDPEIAHFFKEMATSTLLVTRVGVNVIIEYHGRNEVVNSDASKLSDKIRNIVVGLGAKMGLSFSQWKSLIDGLADDNNSPLNFKNE